MNKKAFKTGIRFKFLGIVFVALFVMSTGLSIFNAFNNRALLKQSLVSKGQSLASYMAKISVEGLIMNNFEKLDELAGEVAKDPEIAYAIVYDKNDKPVTSLFASVNYSIADVKKATENLPKDSGLSDAVNVIKKTGIIHEVAVPIHLDMNKMGAVSIGMSMQGVQHQIVKTMLIVIGLNIVFALLLSIVIYSASKRIIIDPLLKIQHITTEVAAGDLSRYVTDSSSDEIGELGRAMNRMIKDLKNMIGNVHTATLSVDKASWSVKEVSTKITKGGQEQSQAIEDAASSVQEMNSSLKEIGSSIGEVNTHSSETASSILEMSTSVEQVAQMMRDLSASIEDTSSAIVQMSVAARSIAESVESLSAAAEQTAASASEMSATVNEVEKNAKESAALAAGVLDDAEKLGIPSIDKTIEAMNRIEEASRKSAEAVGQLRERSQNIGKIVTVIDDITDQTGLLALNAQILAAQAGQHGKGFAVVASEMRELANRTAFSTQEITDLISKVQEETQETVKTINHGASQISEGVRLSREAGDALKKILERAALSREMSWSISHAADEQAKTVGQVKGAIEKINEMTHQIMKAAKEQQSGSEQITDSAEKMREITRVVNTATSEQAKGSKDITAGVESMNTKIGMVNRAAAEVQTESDMIVKAIERIKEIAQVNTVLSNGLSGTVEELAGQSATLSKEIKRFKTDEDGKE